MGKKIKKVFNKPSLITEWQEWDKVPEDLPKRWSKPYGDDGYKGLTEFESKYGDDKIKLGKLYTDKDRPPFKTIKEEFAIDDAGWKNVTGMIKGFFEDMKNMSASISGKNLKKLYRALDGIDKRQLGIKDVLKKHMKEAYPRYDKDGKEIEEGIKRWKVYIKGESKPLILTGKDERDVKQLAHAMIRNSSVKIAKVVREGKLTEISNKVIQNLKDTNGKMWDYYYQEKPAYVQPFNEPRGEKIKVKDIKDKKLKVKIKQLDKILREQKLREQIRGIIKEQLNEKTFGSQAQYDAYRKKHTLKPGTKVKVAGKTITVRGKGKMSKKAKSLGDRMADKLNKRMADLEKKRKQGKIKEAITGADRKILFILVREIVRNLKSKIKNFDVNNKSHLNRVGSSILAIIRAMSYSPDNVNYKNFKKYFPKGFNSKLIQKKLKQFHSQTDKVQMTLVTMAIKNELGEGRLRESIREIIKEQLNLNEYVGAGKPIPRNKAKQLFVPENEMIRFSRVFKKLIQKGFVYIGDQTKEKKKLRKHYTVTVDKKMYDNLLDILMSKRFKVKT